MKLVFYCYSVHLRQAGSCTEEDLGLFFFAMPPALGQRAKLRETGQPVVITDVNHCWMTIELRPEQTCDATAIQMSQLY